jgi:hypothetical protein
MSFPSLQGVYERSLHVYDRPLWGAEIGGSGVADGSVTDSGANVSSARNDSESSPLNSDRHTQASQHRLHVGDGDLESVVGDGLQGVTVYA